MLIIKVVDHNWVYGFDLMPCSFGTKTYIQYFRNAKKGQQKHDKLC